MVEVNDSSDLIEFADQISAQRFSIWSEGKPIVHNNGAHTGLIYRTKQWLKRFPIFVRSKNQLLALRDRIFYGRYVAIVNAFPVFTPYSFGPCKPRAELTILSAQQTFPFLVHFLEVSGNKRINSKPIHAEEFCADRESQESAARLKSLLDQYGSDKANPNNYHLIYGAILRNASVVSRVLEIGLGSNNADIVSNLGQYGRPGASLRAFRAFLPNANVYGADVDRRILFEEDRIKTFFVDQTDLASFDALAQNVGADFDLIVDDGLHSPNANIAVLSFALPRLRPGGWLVVEDIAHCVLPVWRVVATLLPDEFKPYIIAAKNSIVFAVERTSDR